MLRSETCRLLLCGGLGNQLFQYAYARALTLRSGARLEVDAATMFYDDHRYQRNFELENFSLPEEVEIRRSRRKLYRIERKIGAWLGRNQQIENRRFVSEPPPTKYYPEFASWQMKRSITLLGYWHCEKYFKEFEHQIRRDLRFNAPVAPKLESRYQEICSSVSVAVHVRRKDYEPILALRYYKSAINEYRQAVSNAKFYIFTDDPVWWREQGVRGEDVFLMENQDQQAIEDFKLMVACRHFIVANSSFSWWAAWLGAHHEKRIFAPVREIEGNCYSIDQKWR